MGKGKSVNQLCGCGSGKKAKNCCLARVQNAKNKQQEEHNKVMQRCIDAMKDHGEAFPERFSNMIRARFTDFNELTRVLYIKGKYDILKITVKEGITLGTPEGIDEYLKISFEDMFKFDILLEKNEKKEEKDAETSKS